MESSHRDESSGTPGYGSPGLDNPVVTWYAIAIVSAGAPAFLGRVSAGEDWWNRAAVGGLVLWAGLAALITAQGRATGVPDSEFIDGLLAAALVFGVLPFCAYYTLGRWLARRPVVLLCSCAATLVPFAVYLVLMSLWIAGMVSCSPGQYECPV